MGEERRGGQAVGAGRGGGWGEGGAGDGIKFLTTCQA